MPFLAESIAQGDAPTRSGPRIVREDRLVHRVVCVGGQGGCGKSLITPIIGSFRSVEIQKYRYQIEHLCWLSLMGRLDPDVATVMIRMLADTDLYDLAMAREVNVRMSDLSSIFKNPDPWRYLRRLVLPGDAAAIERIRREAPVLHYLTHNVLAISPPLMAAFGDRLRIVEVVRHPLYMLQQLYLYYTQRHRDTTVRDFTIWFDYQGQALPCVAFGWEERYLRSNPMDRVIYASDHLSQRAQRALQGLSEAEQTQVMILPFERFVLDPRPYLNRLEALLGVPTTRWTERELKRQRVPRAMIAQGIPEPIYKQYGWQPPGQGATEAKELKRRRAFVAEHASPEGLAVLDRLCHGYEAQYVPEWLP